MFPSLGMSLSHLRLQETSKSAINGPPDTVALLNSTLDDILIARQTMYVHPDTFGENPVQLLLGMFVFYKFCASRFPPKLLTAPVSMLAPGTGTNRHLG
jgi:hypothetical protein